MGETEGYAEDRVPSTLPKGKIFRYIFYKMKGLLLSLYITLQQLATLCLCSSGKA